MDSLARAKRLTRSSQDFVGLWIGHAQNKRARKKVQPENKDILEDVEGELQPGTLQIHLQYSLPLAAEGTMVSGESIKHARHTPMPKPPRKSYQPRSLEGHRTKIDYWLVEVRKTGHIKFRFGFNPNWGQ